MTDSVFHFLNYLFRQYPQQEQFPVVYKQVPVILVEHNADDHSWNVPQRLQFSEDQEKMYKCVRNGPEHETPLIKIEYQVYAEIKVPNQVLGFVPDS